MVTTYENMYPGSQFADGMRAAREVRDSFRAAANATDALFGDVTEETGGGGGSGSSLAASSFAAAFGVPLQRRPRRTTRPPHRFGMQSTFLPFAPTAPTAPFAPTAPAASAATLVLDPGNDAEVGEGEDALACSVCLSNRKAVLFTPCSHITCCRTCTLQLQATTNKCPICRGRFVGATEVFV